MPTIEIKNIDGDVLWSGEADSQRDAVIKAVASGTRLAGANLAGANLVGANLAGAYLAGAYLNGANLARAANWLGAIRDDVRRVLSATPHEVPGLLAAIRAGKVDGSCYEGECACLLGTIANVRHCAYTDLGVTPNCDSPAERFFMRIRPGMTPLNSMDAAVAALWCLEFLEEQLPLTEQRKRQEAEASS